MVIEDASVKVLDMELHSQSSIFKRPFFLKIIRKITKGIKTATLVPMVI